MEAMTGPPPTTSTHSLPKIAASADASHLGTDSEVLSPHAITLLGSLRTTIALNAPRVARLGGWADRLDDESLISRVPVVHPDGSIASGIGGFDAGIACCLDLIPRSRQLLAARLHGAYTTRVVEQLRDEIHNLEADSEATWWLAACSVCDEGPIGPARFEDQVAAFQSLAADPTQRLLAAQRELIEMLTSFRIDTISKTPVPMALRDGGMQGAYLSGFEIAGHEATNYGLFFVGSYKRSLGLENFAWAEPPDPQSLDPDTRRGRSGPVSQSANFVKAADRDEFEAVIAAARPHD